MASSSVRMTMLCLTPRSLVDTIIEIYIFIELHTQNMVVKSPFENWCVKNMVVKSPFENVV